jgi:prostatic aicd phosphatase
MFSASQASSNMKTTTIIAASLFAAAPAIAETIHGLVVFTRHGDRTSKTYKGYQMTPLGAEQVFQSGSRYRQRYIEEGAPSQILGISADEYKPSQLWTSAPDQSVSRNVAI